MRLALEIEVLISMLLTDLFSSSSSSSLSPFSLKSFLLSKNNVESSILTLRLSLKCPATRARALERLIRCRRNPSTYLFAFARKQKRNRRRNRSGRGDEIERDTILLRYNFLRVSERYGEEEEEEEEVDF